MRLAKIKRIAAFLVLCEVIGYTIPWSLAKLEILPEYEKEFFGAMFLICIVCAFYFLSKERGKSKNHKAKVMSIKKGLLDNK